MSENPEEFVERRASVKGNPARKDPETIQSVCEAESGLSRVPGLARRERSLKFTNLMHHIDARLLKRAYMSIRRNCAVGMDGQTWKSYGSENLDAKLEDLRDRVQSGRYKATPSKRVWIPKQDGTKRPLGIAKGS